MRRLALWTALACIALSVAPAVAKSPGSLGVSPNKAGKGSTVTLDLSPPKAGQNPRSIVVRVVRGVKVDPRAVAVKCTASQASSNSCPAKSRIGGGTVNSTVTSNANAVAPQKIVVQVDLFLAPPPRSGDTAGVVVHFKVTQTGQQGHVTARITPIPSGPFGVQTSLNGLDTVLKPPTGFKAHADRVHLSFGAKRTVTTTHNGVPKKVHYTLIRNPSKCTGTWPYQIRLGYPDGSTVPADGSGPCKA